MHLLFLSGLKGDYDIEKGDNKEMFIANSSLFEVWTENYRYKPVGSCEPKKRSKTVKGNRKCTVMDKRELKKEIMKFIEKCNSSGYTLDDFLICEAYPGDPTTSYVLKVGGPWVEGSDCFEAIEELSDIMWETMSLQARKKIFRISLYTENDELYCTRYGTDLLTPQNTDDSQVPA